MHFANLWGLLAFLSIPMILLFYLLMHKYKEKEIHSTYIWKVSERFEKKKMPIYKMSQPWLLFFHLLTAIVLSFSLTHPIITTDASAENLYFILDNSGSMNIQEGNQSRFDKAKDKIASIVKKTKDHSCYSIITLCDEPKYVLREVEEKDQVYQTLTQLRPSTMVATTEQAMSLLQEAFAQNPSIHAYFVTDKEYENTQNIDVISIGEKVENYAVTGFQYRMEEGHIYVEGEVISYESDADIRMRLLLDDVAMKSQTLKANKLEKTPFLFRMQETDFAKITVEIMNLDALSLDNQFTVFYQEEQEKFQTAIVSRNPFYLETILNAMKITEIETFSPNTYQDQRGYDLYVFDGYAPTTLPTDGGILLFDTDANISSSGFIYQNQSILERPGKLEYTKENSAFYQAMTKDTIGDQLYISKYRQYSINGSFTSIMTYEGRPVIFAGVNDHLTREVVFAFDLHDSTFPLSFDFIAMMRNMIHYMVPSLMNTYTYTCGSDLIINVLPNCESIELISPSKQITFLDIESHYISSYPLRELGEYQVNAMIDGEKVTVDFFSSFSSLESKPNIVETSIALVGKKEKSRRKGAVDLSNTLLMIGIVLCLLDWLLYCFSSNN